MTKFFVVSIFSIIINFTTIGELGAQIFPQDNGAPGRVAAQDDILPPDGEFPCEPDFPDCPNPVPLIGSEILLLTGLLLGIKISFSKNFKILNFLYERLSRH